MFNYLWSVYSKKFSGSHFCNKLLQKVKLYYSYCAKGAQQCPRFRASRRTGEPLTHWKWNALAGAGVIVSSVEDMLTFAEAH